MEPRHAGLFRESHPVKVKTLLFAPEVFLADGGIARILRGYLHALCNSNGEDRDNTVGLIVLNDTPECFQKKPDYLADDDITPQIGCKRSKMRFVLSAFRHALTTDRIICGHLHLAPIARAIKWFRPRLTYYIVAHGIEVWRPYSSSERRALLNATRIICVSEFTRRQMMRFLPELDPDRLVVIPNTLDPDFTLPPAIQPRNIDQDLRLLTVSRLTTADNYKGIDTLIEAMPQIRDHLPKATLRIVGTGDDKPRLLALAANNGVTEAVTFLGRLSDEALRDEYARCDLFALPSLKEGFGLVYLEAMRFGKPCLAARAGGAPEVVTEEVGALIEYNNADEIADTCVRIGQNLTSPELMRAYLEQFNFSHFKLRLSAALTN